MKRCKLPFVVLMFAAMSLGLGMAPTKASADERGWDRDRHDRGEHRGWGEREHIQFRGERYDYHEGRFYRPGLFGFILDLVLPPRGIVVTYLPVGYRTIIIGRATYYEYENVYYQPCPGGYTVVQPPAEVNQYVTSPVVYAPNVGTPYAQPQSSGGTVVVNVPSVSRGSVAITLIRNGSGFTGPQGEYYAVFPSTDELSARYGQ